MEFTFNSTRFQTTCQNLIVLILKPRYYLRLSLVDLTYIYELIFLQEFLENQVSPGFQNYYPKKFLHHLRCRDFQINYRWYFQIMTGWLLLSGNLALAYILISIDYLQIKLIFHALLISILCFQVSHEYFEIKNLFYAAFLNY